jgi:hypothetical protein
MAAVPISSPSDDRDAADRAAYEADGNPLHAIMAFLRYRPGEPIPAWVHAYLLNAFGEIARIAIDPTIRPVDAACKEVPRALGLIVMGKNAFERYRKARENSFIAASYTILARKGQTKVATGKLAGALKIKDRAVLDRIAKGRIWSKER